MRAMEPMEWSPRDAQPAMRSPRCAAREASILLYAGWPLRLTFTRSFASLVTPSLLSRYSSLLHTTAPSLPIASYPLLLVPSLHIPSLLLPRAGAPPTEQMRNVSYDIKLASQVEEERVEALALELRRRSVTTMTAEEMEALARVRSKETSRIAHLKAELDRCMLLLLLLLLPGCHQAAARLLPGCYQAATRLLPGCHQAATRLLQDRLEDRGRGLCHSLCTGSDLLCSSLYSSF